MKKPPAFQFYPDDFLAGTFDMTNEEVGAYVRLLCHQWNRGSIPVGTAVQQRLAGGRVSRGVLKKFTLHNGVLKNERMERERDKQNEYREKQAAKGRKSGEVRRTTVEPRLNHGLGSVEPTYEPNANSPSPSPSPSSNTNKQIGDSPTLDDVLTNAQMIGMKKEDAEAFWHHFESSGWIDKNGHGVKNWRSKQASWKTIARARPLESAHQNAENGNGASSITLSKEYERCIARIRQLNDGCARDAMGAKFWEPKDRAEYSALIARRDELKKTLGITI